MREIRPSDNYIKCVVEIVNLNMNINFVITIEKLQCIEIIFKNKNKNLRNSCKTGMRPYYDLCDQQVCFSPWRSRTFMIVDRAVRNRTRSVSWNELSHSPDSEKYAEEEEICPMAASRINGNSNYFF